MQQIYASRLYTGFKCVSKRIGYANRLCRLQCSLGTISSHQRLFATSATTQGSRMRMIDKGGPSFQDFLGAASSSAGTDTSTGTGNSCFTEAIIGVDGDFEPSGDENENGIKPELTYFIETYGCQMNVSDSEIVRSVLQDQGHVPADSVESADLVLVNTCAIRENAEAKIWNRLAYFQSLRRENKIKPPKQSKLNRTTADRKEALAVKVAMKLERKENKEKGLNMIYGNNSNTNKIKPFVGVLGCMAERLKERLLDEDSVDFVVGPDSYRDIPRLIGTVTNTGQKAANTQLSLEETYADIAPIREADTCSAFVSIMRGCNNMCSYCIVPFTRGRERSRDMLTILGEVNHLLEDGVKEICLLGQNVNGFHDTSEESAKNYLTSTYAAADGFNNLFNSRSRAKPGARFVDLLSSISNTSPELRIRFTSPHPKDFPLEVLAEIAQRDNLCKSLHMPAQSGSSSVLQRMRRGYTREVYLELVERAREIIPGVTISTDMITGFCGETEEEHADTLSLMEHCAFDQAFMFAYSLRDKTHASHNLIDDVPLEVKNRRLQEVIDVYRRKLKEKNSLVETFQKRLVLVEGAANRSTLENPMWTGRTDGNKRVVFSSTNSILPCLKSPHLGTVLNILNDAAPIMKARVEKTISEEMKLNNGIAVEKSQGRLARFVTDTLHAAISTLPYTDIIIPTDVNRRIKPGDYVVVFVAEAEGPTLRGTAFAKSTMAEFHNSSTHSLK